MTTAFAGRHTCDSPEWYTPIPFVEAARELMGAIDLDPASHEEANARIKAGHYFTAADNGLAHAWHGRVFLNPPGGLVNEFWKYLTEEFTLGRTTQAVWIGYSLEQLQTLQNARGVFTPMEQPICVTAKRIAFVENEAKKVARMAKMIAQGKNANAKSSPSHSNYISYLGPPSMVYEFARIFSRFGQVKR